MGLVLTMRDRLVACCPCFETLASLAPQHEVVVFQQARPHPEEAANGSRECAPDDRLRGRLEGWAAIPICDSHPKPARRLSPPSSTTCPTTRRRSAPGLSDSAASAPAKTPARRTAPPHRPADLV